MCCETSNCAARLNGGARMRLLRISLGLLLSAYSVAHLDEGLCPEGDALLHIGECAAQGRAQRRHRLPAPPQPLLKHLHRRICIQVSRSTPFCRDALWNGITIFICVEAHRCIRILSTNACALRSNAGLLNLRRLPDLESPINRSMLDPHLGRTMRSRVRAHP